jgi:hypothetical protein
MAIAQHTRFEIASGELRSRDITILLGYAAFAVMLLVAIYFDSMAAGTAPGDFAAMTVLP